MVIYHDTHGHMPPAVVFGENGQPLYSWRVLVLPYFEQQELYSQFHLDEPWDSPHNLTLLERMPCMYAPPPGKRSRYPAYHTICHVFVGKGTPFEEGKKLKLTESDFPDGTSNTILIIEAGPPVPWTKPEEIPFDPDGSLPQLDTLFPDIIRLVDAWGSRHHVRTDISETTLRAAITRNGGERLGLDW
jgi:Protein of unknown function (DUF1559)